MNITLTSAGIMTIEPEDCEQIELEKFTQALCEAIEMRRTHVLANGGERPDGRPVLQLSKAQMEMVAAWLQDLAG